jgi:uroporphyrin-III C-methyltransferase
MLQTTNISGRLILAGAGPGDPELITLKTARYLATADVVLTDRLVSSEILDRYVNPEATVIHVGKQCRRGKSTPQGTINELIVHYCLLGKVVVRLKGGDVSVFSNILEELETAREYNIAYEIIPGITAALGAAAYSGIPLTARGFATAVRFLTCYKSDVVSDVYWQELAATDDTLVFYMSSEMLDELVRKLVQYHIDENKKLAIIEQATTPGQFIEVFDLYHYHKKFNEKKFISPSLVVIGNVVALQEKFGWLPNPKNRTCFFKPVPNHHLIIDQPENLTENVA